MGTKEFLLEAENYKMIYDLHTHTVYSHGKGEIEDNILTAISKGLETVAIADHGPGHLNYGIKRQDIGRMRAEVDNLAGIHQREINVLLGVEANIISTGKGIGSGAGTGNGIDLSPEEMKAFDFIIAGYHYGVKNGYCVKNWVEHHLPVRGPLSKKMRLLNTEMTVNALYQNDIKILSHPGDKGQFDILAIAKACRETDTLMEINTWHKHLSVADLKLLKNTENKFIISSDAHKPERVGDFESGLARALEAGIDPERIVNIVKR